MPIWVVAAKALPLTLQSDPHKVGKSEVLLSSVRKKEAFFYFLKFLLKHFFYAHVKELKLREFKNHRVF